MTCSYSAGSNTAHFCACEPKPAEWSGCYASFNQSCSALNDAEQDAAMDAVCAGAVPGGRAASTTEIISGGIGGMPATNQSSSNVMFTCPGCEGNPVGGCKSGHARKCHSSGAWPTTLDSGWNLNGQSSSRKAVCVCDGPCAAPTCGDGTVHSCSEQCDDGNKQPGDGCSSACQNEVCGDLIVNNNDEECDTGGTTLECDGDCTQPLCGDGFLNEPAGEQCDDGDKDPGDGCDALCQLEVGPTPTFSGCYAGFNQNCGQPAATQDQIMDAACDAAVTGSRAATTAELVQANIAVVAAINQSNSNVMFSCPFCQGNPVRGCASGFARKCHSNGAWPTKLGSRWNLNCQSSSRKAMCVCNGGPCIQPTCGDGTLATCTEQCDDNNHQDGDGCSSTC